MHKPVIEEQSVTEMLHFLKKNAIPLAESIILSGYVLIYAVLMVWLILTTLKPSRIDVVQLFRTEYVWVLLGIAS